MAGKVNLGDRLFPAINQGQNVYSGFNEAGKKSYNFAATYNVLVGAGGFTIPFVLFDALFLPNPAILKAIYINGTFIDTANGSQKAIQPLIEVSLFPTGFGSNINAPLPQYTLNVNSQLDGGVTITGLLNHMPIKFETDLYIAPQTSLTLSGNAYLNAVSLATDSILINGRLVFEV